MDANIQQRRANNFDDQSQQQQQQNTSIPTSLFTQSVATSVGNYVFTTGRQKAQQALNIYSHIDYLRPYFDVEPKDVLNRLLYSVLPLHRKSNINLHTELYGPLMIMFTLCAIIIYQMKLASHAIQDGTLIGTSFFVVFSYWIASSFLLSSSSFICSSTITFFNYLSLIGYSLFSHSVVLLIGTFVHTSYDHQIFYFLWLVLGGAAGLKLAFIIYRHTPHPSYRIGLAVFVLILHLGFLLYIHFAYHELAEEVSHALFDTPANIPAKLDVLDKMDIKNEPATNIGQGPVLKALKKRFSSSIKNDTIISYNLSDSSKTTTNHFNQKSLNQTA